MPTFSFRDKPNNVLIENNIFRYYIGTGNNSELVRRVMQKRINWKEVPSHYNTVHFRWHSTSRGLKYFNFYI